MSHVRWLCVGHAYTRGWGWWGEWGEWGVGGVGVGGGCLHDSDPYNLIMIELTRTVRFCLNDDPQHAVPPRHNTFSAWPPMRGLGRFYQVHVTCAGQPDPKTGYFLNIKHIDTAFRNHVLPNLNQLIHHNHANANANVSDTTPKNTAGNSADIPMGNLLHTMLNQLQKPLHDSVVSLAFELTPFYSLTMHATDPKHITIRQQYDFAAAHRLHVADLSDEQNRDIFGKCNNPSGHGHNYRVEVAVICPINPDGNVFDVEQLDAVVDEHAIEKLDHKHLNCDVAQFADLNPSVENIAMVIYDMLHDPIAQLCISNGHSNSKNTEGQNAGGLDEIRVWETGKTVCTYRG